MIEIEILGSGVRDQGTGFRALPEGPNETPNICTNLIGQLLG